MAIDQVDRKVVIERPRVGTDRGTREAVIVGTRELARPCVEDLDRVGARLDLRGEVVAARVGKAVQKLLGHSSIQTTGDIYADWDIDQLARTLADVLADEDE